MFLARTFAVYWQFSCLFAAQALYNPGMRIAILSLLLFAAVVCGQTPADPQFEVASIRAAGPLMGRGLADIAPKGTPILASGWMSGGPGTSDPKRLTYTRVLMMSIVRNAFPAFDRDQVLGPAWLLANDDPDRTERYDLAAKVPPGTTKEQLAVMLQSLLKSRCGLVFHYEKKEYEVLALVIAKNGPKPKLKPTPARSDPVPSDGPGTIRPASSITLDADGFPVLPAGRPGFSGRGSDGRMRTTAQMQSAADIAKWVGFIIRNPHN